MALDYSTYFIESLLVEINIFMQSIVNDVIYFRIVEISNVTAHNALDIGFC